MKIAGKVIAITGGASGMGAATARNMAALGARVVVMDVQREAVERIAKEVNGLAIVCDISQPEQVRAAFERLRTEYNALHGLVQCAGIATAGKLVGRSGPMPSEDFLRTLEINLIGTFYGMREAAALMVEQGTCEETGERGVVINTASIAAYEGQVGQVAYSASKGGVIAMTLPAARELGRKGIRVMTIAPGLMETPMMSEISDEYAARLEEAIVFPKRLGFPEEYAAMVQSIFENVYLNGSVMRLDAGLRMPAV